MGIAPIKLHYYYYNRLKTPAVRAGHVMCHVKPPLQDIREDLDPCQTGQYRRRRRNAQAGDPNKPPPVCARAPSQALVSPARVRPTHTDRHSSRAGPRVDFRFEAGPTGSQHSRAVCAGWELLGRPGPWQLGLWPCVAPCGPVRPCVALCGPSLAGLEHRERRWPSGRQPVS